VSNIIPITSLSWADAGETTIVEQVEQIPGEVDVDRVIKAQASAPHIAQRVRELEDCLWAVARELRKYDQTSTAAERAKLLLKNRLEIDIRR
jgi:predicted CoA-binding protein